MDNEKQRMFLVSSYFEENKDYDKNNHNLVKRDFFKEITDKLD